MNDDETSATEAAVDRGGRQKKRWSDLSSGQQGAIVLGAVVELVVTAVALRDLIRRPAAQVRGRNVVWVLTFFVQPVGPIAYFLVGRRTLDAPRP